VKELTGIALDLGGTKIAVARYSDGQVVESDQVATDGTAGSEAQINTIVKLLQNLKCSETDRVGVAVSGRVDSLGQWYAVNKKTLVDIEKVPLKEVLQQRLKRPVAVVNDAVAGALAEAVYGAGRETSAFAFITVSTGVGGVCVLNGKPVVSDDGLAGHIGFMTSRNATQRCGSGRMGTVESIASGRAMEKLAVSTKLCEYSAKDILECHRGGQAWATHIVESSAKSIAELSANLAAAVGISKVVLCGGVGLSKDYDTLVQAFVNAEPELFRVQVERAQLGAQAVLIGALVDLVDVD